MNGRLLLAIGVCALLAGCGREEESQAVSQTAAEVRTAVIQVDGKPDTIPLQRYESDPGAPLPFVTYLPAGIVEDTVIEGREYAVKFVSQQDPRAWVHVFVHPPEQTLDGAREDIRAVAESYGVPGVGEVDPSQRYPWTAAEYQFRSRGTVTPPLAGSVALGRHAGRFFHVIVQYPVEFGDAFVPRARLILDHWRWRDTGRPLAAELPGPS